MATPQRSNQDPPAPRRRWLAVPSGGQDDRLLTVATPVVALLILVAFAVGSLLRIVEDIPVVLGGIVAGILTSALAGIGSRRGASAEEAAAEDQRDAP